MRSIAGHVGMSMLTSRSTSLESTCYLGYPACDVSPFGRAFFMMKKAGFSGGAADGCTVKRARVRTWNRREGGWAEGEKAFMPTPDCQMATGLSDYNEGCIDE